MANLSALDSTNATVYYDFDGLGTAVAPFTAKSPVLLGALNSTAAANPTAASASINALLRGLWATQLTMAIPSDFNDYNSLGTQSAGTMKASGGRLFMISATNLNASVRYLQLHNTTTAPATGAVPLKMVGPVYGGSGQSIYDQQYFGVAAASKGLFMGTGISWAMSTTPLTYTPATAAETIVEARWL
jgi:hypothetical protein